MRITFSYILLFIFCSLGQSALHCQKSINKEVSDTWLVSYKMGYEPPVKALKSGGAIADMEQIFPSINLWSHPNLMAQWRKIPNDPDYPLQWGMEKIGMEQVWDITTGGKAANGEDIVIAIFDDGFQVDHRDYADNVWINEGEIEDNGIDDDGNGFIDDKFGWNATAESDDHNALNHGTSVAGIIGANGDNNSLMAGMNWSAKMMLTSGGTQAGVDLRDIVKAYNYVFGQRRLYNETNGALGSFVVALNYSGGADELFPEDFPAWCEVIEELGNAGVLTIGSVTNNESNIDEVGDLPATCPTEYLIIVTNTNRFDTKTNPAGFGGVSVDLGAPGDNIFTLAIGDDVDPSFFGTSAAAPFVAGIIPLMYSVVCEEELEERFTDPGGMALRMKSAIINNVENNVGLSDITVTGGRLDAFKAIEAIDASLGNCCEVEIEELTIVDESCIGASDGQLSVGATGMDLNGPLQYELRGMTTRMTELASFNRLGPDMYRLTVSDPIDDLCSVDTTLDVIAGTIECPFGSFEITNVTIVGSTLQLEYSVDEQKNVQIQIHDSVGRLIYDQIVIPELSGIRSHEVETSTLPSGVYYASILATGFRDVTSFRVANF